MILSFTLSRLQRIANPPERLVYVCAAAVQVAVILLVVVKAPLVVGIIFLLILYVSLRYVFRGPIISFVADVTLKTYLNTLELHNRVVKVGIDGLQWVVPRFGPLRVSKGLFGTFLMREPLSGRCWVVPRDVIAESDLRNLAERHQT